MEKPRPENNSVDTFEKISHIPIQSKKWSTHNVYDKSKKASTIVGCWSGGTRACFAKREMEEY